MENEAHGLLSMPGVGFFGMLVIGILAGYIAEKVTASDHGLLTNLLVGIAGSFVGGSLATLLNIVFYGWVGNLIVATVGAILLLWVWRRFEGTVDSIDGNRVHQPRSDAAAPSGKGAAARYAGATQARLDPRTGTGAARLRRNTQRPAPPSPQHRVRGGGLS